MILIRKNVDRGHANHGWLDAHHSFSFGNYHDPAHMGFRSLRVMNEDRINPGAGFPTHPHRDMEIITYVLEGELAHKDSTGGGGVIRPGIVQYMSAGTGVRHSEYNASDERGVHLYQIWILPDREGHVPNYQEQEIPAAHNGELALVTSGDGRNGSIRINQDADLFAGKVKAGASVRHSFGPGRYGWLQVAKGGIELPEGSIMQAGDGAKISDETEISLTALDDSEILLFDLA